MQYGVHLSYFHWHKISLYNLCICVVLRHPFKLAFKLHEIKTRKHTKLPQDYRALTPTCILLLHWIRTQDTIFSKTPTIALVSSCSLDLVPSRRLFYPLFIEWLPPIPCLPRNTILVILGLFLISCGINHSYLDSTSY